MRTNENGVHFVSASECCELFEESQIEALAPLRECWFCKWSDFRQNTKGFLLESPCHHPAYQNEKEGIEGNSNQHGFERK